MSKKKAKSDSKAKRKVSPKESKPLPAAVGVGGELDPAEQAALETYQRTVAEHRARKEAQASSALADSWQYDPQQQVFSLRAGEGEVARLQLDEQSLRAMVEGFNSVYILPEDEPPSYQVRIPDLYDSPPVLSLVKGGRVIGSLALDEDFNERVGYLLQERYPPIPPERAWVRFKAWVKAHKVRAVLLALLVTPVLVLLVQGAYTSVVASFN